MTETAAERAGLERAGAERALGEDVATLRADLARGERALKEQRLHEADGIALDLLAHHPQLAQAHALRAFVAAAREEFDRAVPLLEAATAGVDEPTWLALLCNMYRRQFRLDDALRTGKRSVACAQGPARLTPLLELARIHLDRDEGAEAAEAFLAVLAIEPEHPGAHLGLGQVLLARGEFGPGWIEYEWRSRLPEAQGRTPAIKGAAWNGMAMPRGRLLVICDQGFGDGFHFARFLPAAAARVKELVLAASPEIEALLGRVRGVARCHHAWSDLPGFSAYVLISSLPGLLEVRADTIPAEIPYLAPDPALAAAWRERLGTGAAADRARARRRVAIFWSGRPTHPNNGRRSLTLARLAPVLDALGDADIISIQKDRSAEDAALLARRGIRDLGPELASFDVTAAVLAQVDLLVTVDSAVAHLAGAIGCAVAMLLPTPADWRWGSGTTRSPWYPGIRLFRQPVPGDWDGAIAALAESAGAGSG